MGWVESVNLLAQIIANYIGHSYLFGLTFCHSLPSSIIQLENNPASASELF